MKGSELKTLCEKYPDYDFQVILTDEMKKKLENKNNPARKSKDWKNGIENLAKEICTVLDSEAFNDPAACTDNYVLNETTIKVNGEDKILQTCVEVNKDSDADRRYYSVHYIVDIENGFDTFESEYVYTEKLSEQALCETLTELYNDVTADVYVDEATGYYTGGFYC